MNGQPVEEAVLSAGDTFVVGETTFHIGQADLHSTTPADVPVEEVIFSRQDLRRIQYRDADKRMDVLTTLPELISGALNEDALCSRLSHLLLTGIRNAEAVAVVELDEPLTPQVAARLYTNATQRESRVEAGG